MPGREFEQWEDDPAHQALGQWIYSWRQEHPDAAARPGWAFMTHLGREAVELSAGLRRVELLRMFWACGSEGECLCGNRWDQPLPAQVEEET